MSSITALPITQNPGVFGLHPNAEINYFTNSAKEIWVGLMAMQTGEGGSGAGFSKEAYITKVADDVIIGCVILRRILLQRAVSLLISVARSRRSQPFCLS